MRLDAKKKVLLPEMESSRLTHKEASFDGAMVGFSKELSAVRVGHVTVRWIRDEIMSRQNFLGTDVEKFLKVVSKRKTEGSSMKSKHSGTAVTQGLVNIFAHLKYEAAKVSGALKSSLRESSSGAQREMANCVATVVNRGMYVRLVQYNPLCLRRMF